MTERPAGVEQGLVDLLRGGLPGATPEQLKQAASLLAASGRRAALLTGPGAVAEAEETAEKLREIFGHSSSGLIRQTVLSH